MGARPQFIKAAAVSRAVQRAGGIEEVLVHTGQHFDANMSDVFFEEMEIPRPKHNLEIHSLGHGAMTGRMLEGVEKLIQQENPELVLLYGDTNSTIAGALAAKKLHVKVGHVEAGLRSFNMAMPEEINRILTDRISDHLFCPTIAAVENLKKEGFDHFDARVHLSGDVMQDAAMHYVVTSSERSQIVQKLGLTGDFALATIHRAENTDNPDRLNGIVQALNQINTETRVVCPLHPRTRKIMDKLGLATEFKVIDPVGYFDIIELLKGASAVLTDSGGLQKEAYFFKNPCITMRDETEWVELVENGYNTVVGADPEAIVQAFESMTSSQISFDKELYGGGKAADKIVNVLKSS